MQEQRQSLVQQQRLSLSPQLVQSIKLMAMPFADLRDRILEEVEKNPALEIVADPFTGTGLLPPSGAGAPAVAVVSKVGDDESDAHQDFIEGVLQRPDSLQAHLLAQLGEIPLESAIKSLAELIIQNLDRDGFHVVPPSELPGGDDPDVLARALDAVRRLDPCGCATSDFHESLVVQARLLYRASEDPDGHIIADPLLDRTVDILENHFEFLAKGRPDALVKAFRSFAASTGTGTSAGVSAGASASTAAAGYSLDLDEAEGVFSIIRSLDPFPGRAFDNSPESWIVPDVTVKHEEGDFSVVINDEEIPVIGISPFFMELDGGAGGHGRQGDHDGSPADPAQKKARDFARESVKEAQWFIHTIERRNWTILKLVRALVVYQRDFFLHGPSRIVPLRMKDIAAEIGMHEATVSRAANGKYLQCEWGIFELKYFFSNEISSSSKQGVKEIIREIISQSKETLSDQKISDALASRGIKVARRTVAKYRGELTIGSSFDRP
jgi:RNA polymerase sigma-54 factor